MTEYFKEEQFEQAKKQRAIDLTIYFTILGLYVIASGVIFWWYRILPYQSHDIIWVKLTEYILTGIFIIFSFLFVGIKIKRVSKYYRLTRNMITGIRENYTGSFIEYSEEIEQKDGVDFKSLIFLEYNKYKKDFFERKVLVFAEREFPEFKENDNVNFITQGNVLVSYEILD